MSLWDNGKRKWNSDTKGRAVTSKIRAIKDTLYQDTLVKDTLYKDTLVKIRSIKIR